MKFDIEQMQPKNSTLDFLVERILKIFYPILENGIESTYHDRSEVLEIKVSITENTQEQFKLDISKRNEFLADKDGILIPRCHAANGKLVDIKAIQAPLRGCIWRELAKMGKGNLELTIILRDGNWIKFRSTRHGAIK